MCYVMLRSQSNSPHPASPALIAECARTPEKNVGFLNIPHSQLQVRTGYQAAVVVGRLLLQVRVAGYRPAAAPPLTAPLSRVRAGYRAALRSWLLLCRSALVVGSPQCLHSRVLCKGSVVATVPGPAALGSPRFLHSFRLLC